jgi:hypothetical protein
MNFILSVELVDNAEVKCYCSVQKSSFTSTFMGHSVLIYIIICNNNKGIERCKSYL